jgi:hypothetical protein
LTGKKTTVSSSKASARTSKKSIVSNNKNKFYKNKTTKYYIKSKPWKILNTKKKENLTNRPAPTLTFLDKGYFITKN